MPLLGLEPIAGVDYTGLRWDASPGTAAAPADADSGGRQLPDGRPPDVAAV
ncbi:hypothetical protein [Nonomuraea africana]|uniref:Uncharacterized protein n=1 Tax=Nonomuraea africana TaxID=46171 RepID=A0ABR9KRF0_9ACTN|nr:hypothetical protein [Nonomuraea africana]MBE1564616.1 hypothetical protein [Nonomuraea africana]